jgi:hypothetical protein
MGNFCGRTAQSADLPMQRSLARKLDFVLACRRNVLQAIISWKGPFVSFQSECRFLAEVVGGWVCAPRTVHAITRTLHFAVFEGRPTLSGAPWSQLHANERARMGLGWSARPALSDVALPGDPIDRIARLPTLELRVVQMMNRLDCARLQGCVTHLQPMLLQDLI